MKIIIQTEYKTSMSTGAGFIIATGPFMGNVRLPYDHALNSDANHKTTAEALAAKHGLSIVEEVIARRNGTAWIADKIMGA